MAVIVITAIELPDPLLQKAAATAAQQGAHLKDYISQAIQEKLAKSPPAKGKPWLKFAGIAANDPEMVAELKLIEQVVAKHFGQIDPEDWP
jgi:hypothetical protein